MLLALEDVQYSRLYGDGETEKTKRPEISPEDREAAMKLLRDPRLLDRIAEDFTAGGIVGEELNLVVMYLAATSRLLSKPIHILIQSSSAAGKSTMMKAVLAMMPDEDLLMYSALTGQALYYMQDRDLKHKILAIEEDRGAERADYIIKMLQTEGKASIATTIKDPGTGQMSTSDYAIEGPTSCWKTSTALWIDDEVQNRFLVIATDESRQQTERILQMQRLQETLEGYELRSRRDEIRHLHQNAQRLLRPLPVMNPYALQLTFQSAQHRLRRDHDKYLVLIKAVALLRQYQKPLETRELAGKSEVCLLVDLKDIRIANHLANHVLGRTLDELPPHTRGFLIEMTRLRDAEAERLQVAKSDVRLSRRALAEQTGLSFPQIGRHLAKLIEHEYVITHQGGPASRLLLYEILYRGEGTDGELFLPGLVTTEELEKQLAKSHPERES
jgi:hypothetical protein